MYENWGITAAIQDASVQGSMIPIETEPPFPDWKLRIYATTVRFSEEGSTDKMVVLGEGLAVDPFNYLLPTGWNGPIQVFGQLLDYNGVPFDLPSQPYNLLYRNPALVQPFAFMVNWSITDDADIGPEKQTGYRIKCTVTGAPKGVPKAIFLCRRGVDGVGKYADEFLQVCTPGQLAQYPEVPEQSPSGKFRSNVFDVTTQYAEAKVDIVNTLRNEIAALSRAINILKLATPPDHETIYG